MAIVIALILVVVFSVLFHLLSPWYLTPLASNWGAMDTTISITFWVTGLVFIAVNGFMAWAIWRYRYRSDRRAVYEPESPKLESWLTGLTTVGIAALLAPGLFVWNAFVQVPDDARRVEVVGQQWHWSYRYPGEDGELGKVDSEFVSEANPFGMDPDDPAGRDDVLVYGPGLHLPKDEPVQLLLRSKDVLHNFAVPQFRTKMDLIPGQISYTWLTPTRNGDYPILCEELCGVGHFAMRGEVVVEPPEEFEAWLAEQPTYGEVTGRAPGDPERGEQLYAACVACHGPQGAGNEQLNAPNLASLEPWYLERQLEYFKAGVRGSRDDDTYGQQMRPFAQQLATEAQVRDVVAYIDTLPEPDVEATVSADTERGERLYRTCSVCHGERGEGRHWTNAPRLAGQSDWYLVRQLRYFKDGVRGAHPEDLYGAQMRKMSRMLVDESAVRSVVDYINTLPGPKGAEPDQGIARRND